MTLVLDSSICLAWGIADERTPQAMALLPRLELEGGVAPPLWLFEVANGLLMAERRNRIDANARRMLLKDLEALDVELDDASDDHAWSATTTLALRHGLTVYDAAYLELAQRRRLPLATLDQALRRAAAEAGVEVLPA